MTLLRRVFFKVGNLLGMILVVCACSGGSSRLESISDACSLLPKAEVESILETKVTEPEKAITELRKSRIAYCKYSSGRLSGLIFQVVIASGDGDGRDDRDQTYLRLLNEYGHKWTVEKVEGYLTGAIWDSQNNFWIFEGKDFMILSLRGTDVKDARRKAEALARRVIDRLV